MYQAPLGVLLPLSLMPNSPGTGLLCISWNLSFLICKMGITCLSPGLKSASAISSGSDWQVFFLLLVVKHFDSPLPVPLGLLQDLSGVNGTQLTQGEAPNWALHTGSYCSCSHIIASSILLPLVLTTTTTATEMQPVFQTVGLSSPAG